jgi:hypothetical protein
VHYLDGREVRLGDRIRLSGALGKVVCCIDSDEYSPAYPREHWDYLTSGVLIEVAGAGLIHCTGTDQELEFVASTATGGIDSR